MDERRRRTRCKVQLAFFVAEVNSEDHLQAEEDLEDYQQTEVSLEDYLQAEFPIVFSFHVYRASASTQLTVTSLNIPTWQL